jgi:hypothetical protein
MTLSEIIKRFNVKAKAPWTRRPEILLCPNIPKPLHGVAPRALLGTKWWNVTRKAAYAKTNYCCVACGVYKHEAKGPKWLEGHEVYKINYASGISKYLETVALCNYCHSYIHDGRLLAMLDQGKLDHARYAAILHHGDSVLAAAGLCRPSREEREDEFVDLLLSGRIASWGQWRLLLEGKEYPPKYKTEAHWREAMK